LLSPLLSANFLVTPWADRYLQARHRLAAALILLEQQQSTEALKLLDECEAILQLLPARRPAFQAARCWALAMAGDGVGAEASLAPCPDVSRLRPVLGRALLALGDKPRAYVLWQRVLKSHPRRCIRPVPSIT
jgi:tetratricopeptide (TPR) repeat protein